jgi:hypothetical protein
MTQFNFSIETALKHVIKERSADDDDDDEEYEEYEEEYEDDDEEGEGSNTEMETVARIRVVWSNDEEDLYVDHHLQTARMWGIVQGTESEDSITIAEDDAPPPSDSTILVTYSTQAPNECRISLFHFFITRDSSNTTKTIQNWNEYNFFIIKYKSMS